MDWGAIQTFLQLLQWARQEYLNVQQHIPHATAPETLPEPPVLSPTETVTEQDLQNHLGMDYVQLLHKKHQLEDLKEQAENLKLNIADMQKQLTLLAAHSADAQNVRVRKRKTEQELAKVLNEVLHIAYPQYAQ